MHTINMHKSHNAIAYKVPDVSTEQQAKCVRNVTQNVLSVTDPH